MFAKELTIFTDKVYRDKYEAIEDIAHLPNEFVNNSDEYAKAVIALYRLWYCNPTCNLRCSQSSICHLCKILEWMSMGK